jgi:hypothetical protein
MVVLVVLVVIGDYDECGTNDDCGCVAKAMINQLMQQGAWLQSQKRTTQTHLRSAFAVLAKKGGWVPDPCDNQPVQADAKKTRDGAHETVHT